MCGNPTFSENKKNSCRNFSEVMTIDNDSSSQQDTVPVAKNSELNSEEMK